MPTWVLVGQASPTMLPNFEGCRRSKLQRTHSGAYHARCVGTSKMSSQATRITPAVVQFELHAQTLGQ